MAMTAMDTVKEICKFLVCNKFITEYKTNLRFLKT